MSKIVKFVTPASMDGSSKLEKELNAYLTRTFVLSRDVPADECLTEARYLANGDLALDDVELYLEEQFDVPAKHAAKEVMKLIEKFE